MAELCEYRLRRPVTYHESLTRASRFSAFRAAALPARGAEQAAAPPAPRNRLQRIAHQLSHEKNFDHSDIHRPQWIDRATFAWENAARIASAMQFFCGFRDHASLIARAGEFVFAGLAAAVAAGDRGRAVGCAAGDLVELHLAGKTVVQADNGHA